MSQSMEIYKHFENFPQASDCAKEAARILATATVVKWNAKDWVVLVPEGASLRLYADADRAVGAEFEPTLAQLDDVDTESRTDELDVGEASGLESEPLVESIAA